MDSTSEKSNLTRDELLTFLESYRNVIEFNSHVLEEVKSISGIVRNVNVDLGNYHHRLDMLSKDIFFKFELIVGLIKNLEEAYEENKGSATEIKKIKELSEDLKSSLIKFKEETLKDNHNVLVNVKIGWIYISIFFATVIGTMTTFFISYYREIEMLKKLLEHFGIK